MGEANVNSLIQAFLFLLFRFNNHAFEVKVWTTPEHLILRSGRNLFHIEEIAVLFRILH